MVRPIIEDIRRRSRQGATQPFLCRADDNQLYWVKGTKAGNEALCAEWIAGRLGRLLDLPIPEIAQVIVPVEITTASAMEGILDLGSGVRFGSCHVDDAQEYDASFVGQTEENLRQRVFVFDVWVRNTDRTFPRAYDARGNPNLLWSTSSNRLRVIDHNNAFLPDDMFKPSDYVRHVFADERKRLTAAFKDEMLARLGTAAGELDAIMMEIPVEWRSIDAEVDEPHRLTVAEVRRIIQTPLRDQVSFWKRVEDEP